MVHFCRYRSKDVDVWSLQSSKNRILSILFFKAGMYHQAYIMMILVRINLKDITFSYNTDLFNAARTLFSHDTFLSVLITKRHSICQRLRFPTPVFGGQQRDITH